MYVVCGGQGGQGSTRRGSGAARPRSRNAEFRGSFACQELLWCESSLGDTKSSLGDAKSLLGDAESSLGDAKSSSLLRPTLLGLAAPHKVPLSPYSS